MKRPEFQIDISSIKNEDEEKIRKGIEDIRKKNPNLTYTEARCKYFYLEHEKTKTHDISTENHVNEIGLQEASKRDTKRCNKQGFHIDISSIRDEDEERIGKGVEDIREKNPNLNDYEARLKYLKDKKTTTHHISTENHVNKIGLQEASKKDIKIDISRIRDENEERIEKGVKDIREKNPNLNDYEARLKYLKDKKTTTHHRPTANHVNKIGLQEASKRDTKHYK